MISKVEGGIILSQSGKGDFMMEKSERKYWMVYGNDGAYMLYWTDRTPICLGVTDETVLKRTFDGMAFEITKEEAVRLAEEGANLHNRGCDRYAWMVVPFGRTGYGENIIKETV